MLDPQAPAADVFPLPLAAYPPPHDTLWETLAERVALEPFNAVASAIFVLAILHTFSASRVAEFAHHVQHRHDERLKAQGREPSPSVLAEMLHFFGEVEVVFGLWAIVLLGAMTLGHSWTAPSTTSTTSSSTPSRCSWS